MTSRFACVFGVLFCVAFLSSGAIADAPLERGQRVGFMWQGLSDVDATVKSAQGGVVARERTDREGKISVKLPAGDYEIEIDGPSLVAAMDKLPPPPAPEEKESHSSFSLGIGGGMFGGGGSHHSSSGGGQGAGPIGGSQSQSSHGGSHSSGGGVGIGMNIPIGGGASPSEGNGSSGGWLSIALTADIPISDDIRSATAPSTKTSFEMPYCRDGAGRGTRIRFTVPEGGGDISTTVTFNHDNMTGEY